MTRLAWIELLKLHTAPGGVVRRRDVVVIQGAGHFPHRERPAETAEAILAALGD